MTPINHVIIFGDSLSDIGRKAKTIMGKDDFKTTNKIMTISENNILMETFMYKFKNSDTDTKKLIVQKIVEYYNRF